MKFTTQERKEIMQELAKLPISEIYDHADFIKDILHSAPSLWQEYAKLMNKQLKIWISEKKLTVATGIW